MVQEKRLFDAWGLLIKLVSSNGQLVIDNGQLQISNYTLLLDRGYTGHEHLTSVGLIHMNGRLYDPRLHRFLQPDNYVQDPTNTQSYNRYGYCWNNPLKYTDPSGEFIPVIFGLSKILSAIVIGAITSATVYTVMAITTGNFSVVGFLKAAVTGAISGAATFGIGEWVRNVGNVVLKATYAALLHGTFNGMMSGIQGGKFWNGFASGALSSLANSVWGADFNGKEKAGLGWASGVRTDDIGQLAFGTVMGGVGARLTGGNFWQGAATGFMVGLLNDLMHKISKPKTSVIGIYGAGSEQGSGNPDLRKLVEEKGGKMFSSSFGTNDDEIIAYLKSEFENGKQLEIYGHSRGGAAAVRIANKLGAMGIKISQITLYDPVAFYGGGSFKFEYENVGKVTNYYQRNPTFRALPLGGPPVWNTDNPFIGSPVSATFQYPIINNINLTGHYYQGILINHLNITEYAIRNP